MTRYVVYGKSFHPRHEPILAHHPAGSVIDLDDEQAEELVAVGALVKEPQKRSKSESDTDTEEPGSGKQAGTASGSKSK